MKKNSIISLFIIFVFFLFTDYSYSQNWSLLNSAYKYNYYSDSSGFNISTIRVDSIEISGNDSVFYLNRIANESYIFKMEKNVPQFLQKKMIKKNNGDFVFSDTACFLIKPYSSIGDSWIFDTINNITAHLTGNDFIPVLGNYDSIKTIVLSNSDTIVISKDYGIIKFCVSYLDSTKHQLAGIEGLGVGIQIPDFYDFYNFNVGDIFEYKTTRGHQGTSTVSSYYSYFEYKFKILSKSLSTDTFFYNIAVLEKASEYNGYENPYIITFYSDTSTLNFTNEQYDFLNYYNNELAKTSVGYFGNNYRKIFFTDSVFNAFTKNITREYRNDIGDLMSTSTDPWIYDYSSYAEGRGLVNFISRSGYTPSITVFDSTLTGCNINGTIYGILQPDSFYMAATSVPININDFIVFPSPSINELTIKTLQNSEIEIYNIEGQILQRFTSLKNQTIIDITNLAKGIYFVKVKNENGITVRKFIKG